MSHVSPRMTALHQMVHTSEASGHFFMQPEFDVDVFHLWSMCCQDYVCHFFLVMHLNAGLSVVSKCITCASFRGTHTRTPSRLFLNFTICETSQIRCSDKKSTPLLKTIHVVS